MVKERKQMKRGAVRNADAVFVGAWLPTNLVEALDKAVTKQDSDRSKILREALRDKIRDPEAVLA